MSDILDMNTYQYRFLTFAKSNLFDGESFPKRCSFVEHASMNV